MKKKDLISALTTGEPLVTTILMNGKFPVGTISLDVCAIRESLQALLDSRDISMFASKELEDEALHLLKKCPPDEEEVAIFKSQLQSKKRSQLSNEELAAASLDYFSKASEDVLRNRLTQKTRRWIFSVMLKDIEYQLATALLTIQSIAQQRAENEIRKELGMPRLTAKQMEAFVLEAWKESMKRLLLIQRGGNHRKNGFRWTPYLELLLYNTVQELPRIESKNLWDYARKQLEKCDFDVNEVLRLKAMPEFFSVVDLLDIAIRNWSTNSMVRSSGYLPSRHFSMIHALRLMKLDFPPVYRTLLDHYYKGRKLAIVSA